MTSPIFYRLAKEVAERSDSDAVLIIYIKDGGRGPLILNAAAFALGPESEMKLNQVGLNMLTDIEKAVTE